MSCASSNKILINLSYLNIQNGTFFFNFSEESNQSNSIPQNMRDVPEIIISISSTIVLTRTDTVLDIY